MEETVRAFNHIISTGKAFYWGTSEWTAEEIASAWRYADKLGLIGKLCSRRILSFLPHSLRSPIAPTLSQSISHVPETCLFNPYIWSSTDCEIVLLGPLMEQPGYNMLSRDKVEREFERLYEEVGLGLTIFSPLKIGILTGKYNDGIPKDSRLGTSDDAFVQGMNKRVGDESWKKDIAIVAKLKPVADKLEISQATLAMAWVLKNKNVSSAITGASRPEQVYQSVVSLFPYSFASFFYGSWGPGCYAKGYQNYSVSYYSFWRQPQSPSSHTNLS
jgi:aryl-alcohol dehydrogenase-like predicted oxidoreductase